MNKKITIIAAILAVGILVPCLAPLTAKAATVDMTSDSDHDGLTNYQEINVYHTDPNKWDTDGDGYSDGEEVAHGYSPLDAGSARLSNSNYERRFNHYDNGSSAYNSSTYNSRGNSRGLSHADESHRLRIDHPVDLNACNLDSTTLDSDHDGLSNHNELYIYHTNPCKWDTDGDGYNDGNEVAHGYSPLKAGSWKMDEVDTDGDGLSDAMEIALGTNLANPDTDGDHYSDYSEVYNGYDPLSTINERLVSKHVEVDLANQRLYYYFKDVKLGTMLVSTGKSPHATPTGTFQITGKHAEANYSQGQLDVANTKWVMDYTNNGEIYSIYWHDLFGKQATSNGAVQMSFSTAQKLYQFLDVGNSVIIYGQTPSGVIHVNDHQ